MVFALSRTKYSMSTSDVLRDSPQGTTQPSRRRSSTSTSDVLLGRHPPPAPPAFLRPWTSTSVARPRDDRPNASGAAKGTAAPLSFSSVGPVQHDLPALTRAHDLERLRELLRRETVRDHRGDVEAALQHRAHAVPGLEHLATVDPLQGEAAEDHLVPVDRDLLIRDPEKRDATAVVHEREHRAERRGAAGHLEADVESLEHSELFHHRVERSRREVHRERRAKAAREC